MQSFNPRFFIKNPHFQTIFPAFFIKVDKLELELERFDLSDGDFLEPVWSNKPKNKSTKPIVILFHGLAGSVRSAYIQRIIKRAKELDFNTVTMHFRGCYNKPNSLPRSYHSGESNDTKEFINHLSKRYPNAPLFAIGYSLGGNMLLKYLGEEKDKTPIKKAISVSAPMDLMASANRINRGFSKLYQWYLLKTLKRDLLKKYEIFDMQKLIGKSKDDIKKIKTFWQFDDYYTSVIHGFKDAKDYYQKSSSKQFLKYIKIPTLIINAKDDPFMSIDVLPNSKEISSYINLEVYEYGGHVGFLNGGIFKPEFWLENRIEMFLKE